MDDLSRGVDVADKLATTGMNVYDRYSASKTAKPVVKKQQYMLIWCIFIQYIKLYIKNNS